MCLVVAFGGLVFLLEKLGWLIHIKVHKKIPDKLHSAALIIQHINLQKSQALSGTGIPPSVPEASGLSSRAGQSSNGQHTDQRGSIQESLSAPHPSSPSKGETVQSGNPTGHSSNPNGGVSLITTAGTNQQRGEHEITDQQFESIEYSNKAELKYFKDLLIVGLQIVTTLLFAVALFFLIVVIGIIVFTDTVDKDNVQGILTLLPTIVVDVVIIVTRKRFFDNKEALKYQLARVVEDDPETPNERTPLVHSGQQ